MDCILLFSNSKTQLTNPTSATKNNGTPHFTLEVVYISIELKYLQFNPMKKPRQNNDVIQVLSNGLVC